MKSLLDKVASLENEKKELLLLINQKDALYAEAGLIIKRLKMDLKTKTSITNIVFEHWSFKSCYLFLSYLLHDAIFPNYQLYPSMNL